VLKFLDTFSHNVDQQGLKQTLLRYKNLRLAVLRYLSGNPLYELEFIALTSSGFPRELKQWESELMSNVDSQRILLTLLNVGRAFKIQPTFNPDTITTPSKGLPHLEEAVIGAICKNLGVNFQELSWQQFHFSTKSGPNGPAMVTALTDLDALSSQQKDDIYLLGGEALQVAMRKPYFQTPLGHTMMELWTTVHNKPEKYTRKLSYFSDKEGKTRIIAILDYWTQTCLFPIHDALMGILKGIKQDCTFDQDSFISKLSPTGPYYCYDLSAATDRMPVTLQEQVLTYLLGKDRAAAWKRLLVRDAYLVKDHDSVMYRAGQPMGAYSSWAAMALTHHVLVQYSAFLAGVITPNERFTEYVLLGDDLVIADREVAFQYKALCLLLDMPINDSKSLVSNDMFEFAKRIVYKGVEISGFSIGGLLETQKKYSLLHEFLRNQAIHGWNLPIGKHPDLISAILGLYGKFSHRERIIKLYMVYHYVSDFHMNMKAGTYIDRIQSCEQLILSVREYFQRSFPLWEVLSPPQMYNLLVDFVQEVKLRIVVRDIEKLFDDNAKIQKSVDLPYRKHFPSLSVQLLQALRRECNPITEVVNRLLRKSVEEANTLVSDPSVDIFEIGISKYFVGKEVFSLRRARSISLAQAQLTKQLLDVWQDRALEAVPMIQYIHKYTGVHLESPLRDNRPSLSRKRT